eukprot:1875079-Pyramimonas_sp.AAC.1
MSTAYLTGPSRPHRRRWHGTTGQRRRTPLRGMLRGMVCGMACAAVWCRREPLLGTYPRLTLGHAGTYPRLTLGHAVAHFLGEPLLQVHGGELAALRMVQLVKERV